MQIDVTTTVLDDRQEVRIVRVVGEFDTDETEALAGHLALPPQDAAATVVDLAAVDFADSSLLHALLTARHDHLRAGGSLVLAALSPFVVRLLDLTDTTRAFTVTGTVAEAVDLIRVGRRRPPIVNGSGPGPISAASRARAGARGGGRR
ncbi:STAS domain-containing protein, partial [Yinghuangia sp. YIM S09857]|uniref:STAS domain-containing protein n=1 Tax=Yinghuangia sp. YIM S09857 TaxID=3436929 RepID=UPI003F52E6DD